jgi:hypothetical protein
MQRLFIPTLALIAGICGCSSSPDKPGNGSITPTQAILSAADSAPAGVRGTFEMEVRRVGRQDGNIYLDSELDYRDQRNLVIAVHPIAANRLHDSFGQDIDAVALGKRIKVYGEARRTKIVFSVDGRPTGDYYYQTHVDVWDAGQLSILP